MTATNTIPITPDSNDPLVVDVWSRTARRYRIRAVLMLLLLGILFAGSCCFSFWLRTGDVMPWANPQYADILAKSFAPWSSDQVTLADFLTRPIPVQDVPIHAVIMGLQFASICSIPILIAILYRLPASVPFCAMIVLFAAMPWLGITVQIGCILACMGPFRFRFRYASALIGLLPIAIYFVSASWQPAGSPFKMMQNQALLYAPWVLALLASCVICAAALAIARLINYRPGGIPPVLAALFIAPVLLFQTNVGRHELEYRLLEMEIGPGSGSLFASVDVGRLAGMRTIERWTDPTGRDYESIYEETLAETLQEVLEKTEFERLRAVHRCDLFIESFPTSRYVANVLFLRARALDMRIDEARLAQDRRVEFRADMPNVSSRTTWQTLVKEFPASNVAAPAMLQLATLDAMAGRIDEALAHLDAILRIFESRFAATQPAASPNIVMSVFERTDPSERLGIQLDLVLPSARRLRELLLATRDDDPIPKSTLFGAGNDGSDPGLVPVQVLLSFDPAHPMYQWNLENFVRTTSPCRAADYARVQLARMDRAVSRRITHLRTVAADLAEKRAGAEAMFYLADALQEDHLLTESKDAFEALTKTYPDSVRADEARKRISSLLLLLDSGS